MESRTRVDQIAREAFWGGRPRLMALVEHLQGYEMDGQWYPANSVSLQETIEVVHNLAYPAYAHGLDLAALEALR